jgi:hypothetical protein
LFPLSAVGAKCGYVRPLHQGHVAKLQYKPVDKKSNTLTKIWRFFTRKVKKSRNIETKETSDVCSEYSCFALVFRSQSEPTSHVAWAHIIKESCIL